MNCRTLKMCSFPAIGLAPILFQSNAHGVARTVNPNLHHGHTFHFLSVAYVQTKVKNEMTHIAAPPSHPGILGLAPALKIKSTIGKKLGAAIIRAIHGPGSQPLALRINNRTLGCHAPTITHETQKACEQADHSNRRPESSHELESTRR